MLFLNENYVAEYIGKKYGNFIKGHFYRIKIEDNIPYGVMLIVSYDETEEENREHEDEEQYEIRFGEFVRKEYNSSMKRYKYFILKDALENVKKLTMEVILCTIQSKSPNELL